MPLSNPQDISAISGASHVAVTLGSDADTLLGLSTQQVTLDSQNANVVLAGPTSGAAADPTFRALVVADQPTASRTRTLNFVMDGGGSALTTGTKGELVVDFACTLQGWTLLADVSGAIKCDMRRVAYGSYDASTHPVASDSLCNGHEPEIAASGVKAQDNDLSDWSDVTLDAGDVISYYIMSATSITRATLAAKVLV